MLRCLRSNPRPCRQDRSLRRVWPVACVAIFTGVGGCSADVTRFNGTGLGASNTTTGSIGRDYEAPTSTLSEQTPSREYAAIGLNASRTPVSRSAIPYASDDSRPSASSPPSVLNSDRNTLSRRTRVADATPYGDDRTLTDAGTAVGTVIVRRGDTLYGIARANNVSVGALKQANGLTSNTIQPGQALSLPGSANAITGSASRNVPVRTQQPSYTQTTSGTSADRYTVQPGDSLYRISRQTGVSVAALQQINGITDVRSLQPGQVLALRSGGQDQYAAPRQRTVTVQPRTNTRTRSDISSDQAPRAGDQYVMVNPTTPRTKTPATRSVSGFRWPARGRILYGFGPRPDGSHNDGIDIEVPMGSDIRAAADGVVAYADDELEAYGNLVLIRHDNGWVSAYAHADKMLVKRGDTIKRGQVIAKAGKTGAVDRPTLHFELREGAKPVNPIPHLPRG
jgi:murein DD-endopeptidase MepM/ murein hydrolase activator NlpD